MNQEGEKKDGDAKNVLLNLGSRAKDTVSSSQEFPSFSRTTEITKQLRVHQINILELWRVKSSDHNPIQDLDPGPKRWSVT